MAARRETINIAAAKARLPELVERASSGEEIVLARHGKPKAKLVPVEPSRKNYTFGAGRGRWRGIEAVLDKPLPDDILDAFHHGSRTPSEDRSE
jgi:prevent-host-death family protein